MPKSSKSIKVADRDKPWNRYQSSGRKEPSRELNEVVLIVCEGQTEEHYFDSFPVYGITTKVFNSEGQTKLKLVEKAISLQKHGGFDRVWCVFDMDAKFGQKECADFDNAIHKAQSRGFSVAYSNDSFELWLLLHYKDVEMSCKRDILFEGLGHTWGFNYVKEGKKKQFCMVLYSKLEQDEAASQENAIKRAKRQHELLGHLAFHKQNPVTTVYQLVEYLTENLRGKNQRRLR